jgi:type I restriction enzyme S subunit
VQQYVKINACVRQTNQQRYDKMASAGKVYISKESWFETTLGEELTFQRGFDITKKQQRPGPYAVISSSGHKSNHDKFKVSGPGVVIGRKGTLGAVFFSQDDFWPHDTTLWIKDFHGNDAKFAYYFLQTLHLEQYDCGSSNPTLNRNHIHKLPVCYPPLPTQQRIAGNLSAYDDLIDNNTRRIAILEEMAQLIYREWFVHYRFPGHEDVEMVESEMGMIPEGWEVKTLDKIMDFQGGAQPPKNEWVYEPKDGYVRMIQIRDYKSEKYISFVKNSNKLRKCTAKDVMIARYGASVARICYGLDGAYNVALVKVIPKKDIYREYLRAFLRDDFFQKMLLGMSGRTAQAGFNKSNLKSISVVVPNSDTLFVNHYQLAEPILESILSQNRRNQILRRTRDLLLPRLVSGEVDVSELDVGL